jgi:putative transposase
MGHTYACSFHHIIWSTKDWQPLIKKSFRIRLYNYIGGIIKNEKCVLREIGGTANHIHILTQLSPTISLSSLMQQVKGSSSRFISEEFLESKFAWQPGYGAFAVSASLLGVVENYIANQEKHHERISFYDEFVRLLEKHGIKYDEKYLFK